MGSQVAGNIIAAIVLDEKSEVTLFILFGCIGVTSSLIFCFLKPPPNSDEKRISLIKEH